MICNKKDIFDNCQNALKHIVINESFGELTRTIRNPIIKNNSLVYMPTDLDLIIAIEDKFNYDLLRNGKPHIKNLNHSIKQRRIIDGKAFIDVVDLNSSTIFYINNTFSEYSLKLNINQTNMNIEDYSVMIIGVILDLDLRRALHLLGNDIEGIEEKIEHCEEKIE